MSQDIRLEELGKRIEVIAKLLLNRDLTLTEAIRGLQTIERETEEIKKMLDNPDSFEYKGKNED